MPEQKRAAVAAFHAIRFRVIAAGDSYNDVAMLQEADEAILLRPSDKVVRECSQFPVACDYPALQALFERAVAAS